MHPRHIAFGGNTHIGIVDAGAIERVYPNRVAAIATASVIVLLEIARLLVEAQVPEAVVQLVHTAKNLADAESRKLVRNREERIIGEIKLQIRPAIGRKPRIVIAIAVFVCIGIVAAGDGKFSALAGIGIVPTVGRSIRIGRIPQPLRCLLRQVLQRICGDAVSRFRV